MRTTWIVLANASRARIFEAQGERKPKEVASLVHPASRLKSGELTPDRAGYTERPGDQGGGSAYEPQTNPHQKEHRQFAREVAQAAHEAIGSGRCDALVLVASNPFLGELKSCLSDAANRALIESLPKDWTALETPDLQHRLAELLAPPNDKS